MPRCWKNGLLTAIRIIKNIFCFRILFTFIFGNSSMYIQLMINKSTWIKGCEIMVSHAISVNTNRVMTKGWYRFSSSIRYHPLWLYNATLSHHRLLLCTVYCLSYKLSHSLHTAIQNFSLHQILLYYLYILHIHCLHLKGCLVVHIPWKEDHRRYHHPVFLHLQVQPVHHLLV